MHLIWISQGCLEKSSSLLSAVELGTWAPGAPLTPQCSLVSTPHPPPPILAYLLETLPHSSKTQSQELHHKLGMFLPTILLSNFSPFISTLSWNFNFFNEDNTLHIIHFLKFHFGSRRQRAIISDCYQIFVYSFIYQHSLGPSQRPGTVLAMGVT